jgi:hypothetical protein
MIQGVRQLQQNKKQQKIKKFQRDIARLNSAGLAVDHPWRLWRPPAVRVCVF